MRSPPIALAAVLSLAGCVAPPPAAPPVTCGGGTKLAGSQCVLIDAPDASVTCALGVTLAQQRCEAPTPCVDGTVLEGTRCVPAAPPPVTCGAGTSQQGSDCNAPSSFDCGPGTALVGGRCTPLVAPDAGFYDVRVPVTHTPADFRTKLPVLSLGALPSGAPATDAVVLTVIPASAGSVSPASFDLAPQGSLAYFTPRASAGAFRIALARASDPLLPVAMTAAITLEPPSGVSSAAPCLRSDNVLFIDGDPGWWESPPWPVTLLTEADWESQSTAGPSDVRLFVNPWNRHDLILGTYWEFVFWVANFPGVLTPGVYANANPRLAGRPGIWITSAREVCERPFGAFEVHRVTWTDGILDELLVSFEQHCPRIGDPGTAALHGCLHYRR